MSEVLITGVPGWLTDALIPSLLAQPLPGLAAVRGLVQRGGPRGLATVRATLPAEVELIEGELTDPESLRRAMEGVTAVVHAAGIIHVRRTEDWYRINAGGTRALLEAAAAAGVKRFVFISTNAVGGRSESRDHLMCETDPDRPISHYGRSKLDAEQAVRAFGSRMETVILRPCMFYGPPVPARHVEIYRRIRTSRMPLVGDGGYARSLTHIENLVHACRLALTERAAVGQTYYICDEPVYTTRSVMEGMAEALGVPLRVVRLPASAASLALGVDLALAASGVYWQTVHLLSEANWHVGCSCAKAMHELGYKPAMSLRKGMKGAVEWCRGRGLL